MPFWKVACTQNSYIRYQYTLWLLTLKDDFHVCISEEFNVVDSDGVCGLRWRPSLTLLFPWCVHLHKTHSCYSLQCGENALSKLLSNATQLPQLYWHSANTHRLMAQCQYSEWRYSANTHRLMAQCQYLNRLMAQCQYPDWWHSANTWTDWWHSAITQTDGTVPVLTVTAQCQYTDWWYSASTQTA